MNKNYFLLALLCVSSFGFSQTAEFSIDFEGADPLNNLPAGVTSVNPERDVRAFISKDAYMFSSDGGDIALEPVGLLITRAQFANTIVTDTDTSSKVLQADYTGHIVIDEAAFGTGDFTIKLDHKMFGHNMGGMDAGLFTIVGEESAGVWNADRLVVRNGGFTAGMGIAFGGDEGFKYGKVLPVFNDVVLTYTSADKLYRVYKNGVLAVTAVSSEAQTSGEWNNRKIYIGYSGKDTPTASTGTEHLDTTTGEFTADGIKPGNDNRNTDVQGRIDNIVVYKQALTDAEVLNLHNNGAVLSTNQFSKETFNAYPNPVKNVLYFSSNTISSVEIYNVLGAKVLSQKVTNGVDMSTLESGIYLLKAKDANGLEIKTLKVVKE